MVAIMSVISSSSVIACERLGDDADICTSSNAIESRKWRIEAT